VDTEKDGHRISFNETFAEVRFLPSILPLIHLNFSDAAAPPTLIFSVVPMLLVI
jgi:hypothetical protein